MNKRKFFVPFSLFMDSLAPIISRSVMRAEEGVISTSQMTRRLIWMIWRLNLYLKYLWKVLSKVGLHFVLCFLSQVLKKNHGFNI